MWLEYVNVNVFAIPSPVRLCLAISVRPILTVLLEADNVTPAVFASVRAVLGVFATMVDDPTVMLE